MHSDKTKTLKHRAKQLGRRFAMAVAAVIIATSFANAQEPYVFMEGSVHSFSVTNNPANTFAWSMDIDPYNNVDLDPAAYDLLDGGDSSAVIVQFTDMGRSSAELVYLVVEETAPNGCSTKRALQIELQPNNMYFDFAEYHPKYISDDCYSGLDYYADLKVGMNFNDRAGGADMPIPADRFPLKVKYTVRNVTDGLNAVNGNGGEYVVFNYNDENDYALLVPEATGEEARTIEYELAITEVVDKYGTHITHDEDRRLQIRIIIHLPQTGGMDMVMAYNVTPIQYNGGM
jgi:hypothetical protein